MNIGRDGVPPFERVGEPAERVLFDVDSLAIGGLEKKVVRLALGFDRSRFEPALGGALQRHF